VLDPGRLCQCPSRRDETGRAVGRTQDAEDRLRRSPQIGREVTDDNRPVHRGAPVACVAPQGRFYTEPPWQFPLLPLRPRPAGRASLRLADPETVPTVATECPWVSRPSGRPRGRADARRPPLAAD